MARTRGAKSSSPSSRTRVSSKTPVQGSTSEPPRPPRVPPPVEGAPMSPPSQKSQLPSLSRLRRLGQLRVSAVSAFSAISAVSASFRVSAISASFRVSAVSPSRPSQPSQPASEPQSSQPPSDSQIPSGMTPEMIIKRPMLTQPPIEGNLDCRARPFHSELCFDVATFRLQPQLRDSFHLLRRYHMEQLLTPRDFFYPRVAMDFYQSMTTHHVRDPTVIHFTIDGRHGILGARHIAEALRIPYEPARPEDYRVWTNPSPSDIVRILSRGASTGQYLQRKELPPSMFFIDALLRHNIFPLQHWVQRRGALLEALYRISEGFFFGPHHLIMAALLYFEEKVHQKKLLRADAIPLLFPRLLCQILEHLGYPTEPQFERKRICREIFTLDKWTNMTAYMPSAEPIPEVAPSASPATPQPSPVFSATSQPSSSAEPRTTISISEYRALCHTLQTLTTSQSTLTQEMAALRAHQEQIIATQTQHTAILRQFRAIWVFHQPSAPDACPLRAHRADSRRHTDIHLSHYLHIISTHLLDHFHSLLYVFSLCTFLL
ncbi:hypothetical protein CK203_090879 [Vitis vinifera]|uniref:Uncharacterized protein n=1 Tax=Vitis vinifera TaxID=29760 RepID=A0A438CMW6_VITVI|nr:hypothetical protein CK203_090879 [Vitis vinifera]